MPFDPIRVQVRHRDPLLAAGLRTILREAPDLLVTDASQGADGAVILADYDQGLAAMRAGEGHAGRAGPLPKVLVLTLRSSEADVRDALRAGVLGYLVQGCGPEDALQAARCVHRGARYLCPLATDRMASSLVHSALTGREFEVLGGLAEGLSNKLIARELNLAVNTVKSHVGAIFDKLGASSRTQAIIVAAQRGLVQQGQGRLQPP